MTSETESPEPSAAEAAPAAWKRVWWWLRLIIVIGIILALVIIAEPGRLWETLTRARYVWVLAAVPITFAGTFFDAVKLYCLIRPQGFRGGFLSVCRTNLVVNAVSNFIPAGFLGGGVVAWYRLARPDRLHAQTFTALGLNTVLKLVVITSGAALAMALDAAALGTYPGVAPALACCAAVPILALTLMLSTGLTSWVRGVHERRFQGIMPRRVHEGIRKILESLETYRSHRASVFCALVAGYGRAAVSVFCPMFCLYAVGVGEVGYVRLFWIMCAVEATGMLPFTQASFGLPQVTYAALLVVFGVGKADAVASDVLTKIAWLGLYMTGGGVLLWETAHARDHAARAKTG